MASPTQHAYLSASSAVRWLTCPPIISLEQGVPDKQTSYTLEGTDAHALAELKLQEFLGKRVKTKINNFKKKSEFYNEEMEEMTDLYRDMVIERYNSYDSAQMELEVRTDLSRWVPEAFGTSDVVIVTDKVIEIIDLKYGKGVPVSAYQNPQLMLYALGAYDLYDIAYGFEKVRMTIVQPRLDNVSTFEIETEELLYWADNYVAPRAQQAYEGQGEWTITEDVVRFSKVRAQLRPRAEKNFELTDKYDNEEPALLNNNEIAEILARASEIKKWIEDVEFYALDQALNHGADFPGFKVVEGRSNRKIANDEELAERLRVEGYEDIYKPQALLPLGQLEKLVGKTHFNEVASDLIIKPTGKPTLAPEKDKRPALNSTQSAVDDFS